MSLQPTKICQTPSIYDYIENFVYRINTSEQYEFILDLDELIAYLDKRYINLEDNVAVDSAILDFCQLNQKFTDLLFYWITGLCAIRNMSNSEFDITMLRDLMEEQNITFESSETEIQNAIMYNMEKILDLIQR